MQKFGSGYEKICRKQYGGKGMEDIREEWDLYNEYNSDSAEKNSVGYRDGPSAASLSSIEKKIVDTYVREKNLKINKKDIKEIADYLKVMPKKVFDYVVKKREELYQMTDTLNKKLINDVINIEKEIKDTWENYKEIDRKIEKDYKTMRESDF